MAPLFPLVVLLLLSSSCIGSDEHADQSSYVVVPRSSLEHISDDDGAVCSGHKVVPPANRTWLPLHRPHGPCSPIKGTPAIMVDDMLLSDQRRADYIRAQLSNGVDGEIGTNGHDSSAIVRDENADNSLRATADLPGDDASPDSSDHRLAAAAGSSRVSQTLVVDTSSDVPWVQCRPCPSPQCHLQKDELYDPARSRTFSPIPCGSPACAQLAAAGYGAGCSASGRCRYAVSYGDGRATAGDYVTDRLELGPNIVVPNFRFGCSHAVRGFFSDQTAGTLALGGGRQSLRAQAAGTFGGDAFSYCVPAPSASGFLSLGGPVAAAGLFRRTPLVRNNPRVPATFYIVRLEAIAVAGRRLAGVPPAVFAAGAVMDSSMVVTRLPPTAYAALRAAFRAAMAAYPLVAPPRPGGLDTCYDFLRFPAVRVPRVSLVFAGGAAVQLDGPSVMLDGCLAFAPSPSDAAVGFIGNVQQQTYEVLYDVAGGSIGFSGGAC